MTTYKFALSQFFVNSHNTVHYRRKAAFRLIPFVLFLTFIYTFNLSAQCTLVCNGADPNDASQLALNENCIAEITPDGILEAPQECPGPKNIIVRDENNNVISEDIDLVSFYAGAYLNQILGVTIIDVDSGNSCQGFIHVVDNLVPAITSATLDVEVLCNEDTSPAALGYPQVTDNCDGNLTFFHSDIFIEHDCNSPSVGEIIRTWTVVDDSDNPTIFTQVITLMRATFSDITFPPNVELTCDNPLADPAITGQPTINGLLISEGEFCDLNVTFDDDTTAICGEGEFQIIRSWTIWDLCQVGGTNESLQQSQLIHIQDEVSPVISPLSDISVGTDNGLCSTTVLLPQAFATDNCSSAGNISISVFTSWGGAGFGPHYNVPAGTHTVTYTATDGCGNSSQETLTLSVLDNEEPVAVCEEFTIVSIPTTGIALVHAFSFNDASYDNCAPVDFLARRMEDTDLTEEVEFTCEDIGNQVMVVMRVFEIGRPDFYNECMVVVTVQDKLAPGLLCPPDVTIGCQDDYSDLSVFGTPQIIDNCDVLLDSVEVVNVSNCGTGQISRTFTATDGVGNSRSCTQLITIINDVLFTEDQISWPENITFYNDCNAQTDIDDLPNSPINQREPIITDGTTCSMAAVSHYDEYFEISTPACYKILRHWSVIDWCQHDPEHPELGGRWDHVQFIKIMDTQDPELSCPSDTIVGVNNICTSAEVNLPLATATDCSPDITITNNSPFAFSNGADASGIYPFGVTNVEFLAFDACGNVSVCNMKVTVLDNKAPSPVCINGLSGSISNMDGELMLTVPANCFDPSCGNDCSSSEDNCTDSEDLQFFIRRLTENPTEPPTTTTLTFTCDDLGVQDIEFWVVDESGNSDYCVTYFIVQDNNGLCPDTPPTGEGNVTTAMIAGAIQTAIGEEVENVTVDIDADDPLQITTGMDGVYSFYDLPIGTDYTITPGKEDDPLNGVSTYDIVLIAKHILHIQSLDSPYKLIAADVDNSGSISTFDLLTLRKVILQLETGFSNNESWRFIDASYDFLDPANPFGEDYPELLSIDNLNDDEDTANFIAIKTGDVNNSVTPNNLISADDRTANALELLVEDRKLVTGELVEIEFKNENTEALEGFQFTLSFDPETLSFLDVEKGTLQGFSEANMGFSYEEEGMITVSWNALNPSDLPEPGSLFSLTFVAKKPAALNSVIDINSDRTKAEAYIAHNDQTALWDVNLHFDNNVTTLEEIAFELYQNRPNPFRSSTRIEFLLPEAGHARLSIYDVSGKELWSNEKVFEKGLHELEINREQIGVSGILYYRLETAGYTASRKMILTD